MKRFLNIDSFLSDETLRCRVSDGLLWAGLLILLGVALFCAKSALAAGQITDQHYLVSKVGIELPLFELTPTPKAIPVQPTPPPAQAPAPDPLPPTPAHVDSGPAVRLVIPSLGIDRAVVPLGMRPASNGILQWDTDSLFATRNRVDLVGQMVASLNPGMGGNSIMVGHNYDQGTYQWEGVFVNLKNIQPGAKIVVYTQGGAELHYVVQLVKKVPWSKQNDDEWEKHMKFLGPSESERLTLVTCGGANIWPWPARIYVVAVPEG